MAKQTAAQIRLLKNATSITATHLVFEELRNHYPIRQLSDVMTIFNGQALKKSQRTTESEYNVYGAGGKVGNFTDYLSDQSFVVIGRKGSAGKPTYAPNGGWVIDTAYYAQPRNKDVDTKFLFYALSSLDFTDDIISTAIPGINQTAIYKYGIPIPPLELQIKVKEYLDAVSEKAVYPQLPATFSKINHIVERVEALAARIAKAQSLREEAKHEVNFFLKSCLSSIFDYEYGDNLPDGWKWKSFNETLADDGMRTGPFGTLLNKSEIFSKGIPVFGIPNVGNNEFREGFTDFVTHEKAKALSVYVLDEGDIAVARSGTVGRSCVVPKLIPQPIMSSNLIRIRIDKNVFLPELMCQILTGSRLVERHIDKECRGSTRIFFTQKILGRFKIPVPPLDEQRRIMAYLDSVQARLASLRGLQSETQEELNALLPSVLDKAFKGEL